MKPKTKKFHKKHQCVTCVKPFSQAGHLKRHIHTVHEGHKDYECGSCVKSFSQAGDLKRHMQKVHAGLEVTPLKKLLPQESHYIKEQKCETCDKIFTNAGDLLVHIQSMHFVQSMEIESSKNLEEKKSTEEEILNTDHDNSNLLINNDTDPNFSWSGEIDMPQVGRRLQIKAHQVFGCLESMEDTRINKHEMNFIPNKHEL